MGKLTALPKSLGFYEFYFYGDESFVCGSSSVGF